MKFLSIFLIAIYASVSSSQILPNLWERILERLREPINRLVIDAIESQRVNFPVGWPLLGIPPLDPLEFSEFEYSIDQIGTLSSFNFRIDNGTLTGLKNFQIRNLDMRFLRASFEMDLFFDELEVFGDHQTTARLAVVPINGRGDVSIRMFNMRVQSTAKLELINGNFLNLDNFKLRLQVEDAIARFTGFGALDDVVSSAVTSALVAIINASEGAILAERFEEAINLVLNQVRISDIIAAVIDRRANSNSVETQDIFNYSPSSYTLISKN